MNWDAVGAVGEILGAVAVIATIGYLALQVRFAKAAALDANRLNRTNGVLQMLMAAATNDELRTAIVKGQEFTTWIDAYAQRFGVTADEAARLDFSAVYWFWLHWGQYASSNGPEDLAELENIVRTFYNFPHIRYSWEHSPQGRPLLEPGFVAFVDRILGDGPAQEAAR